LVAINENAFLIDCGEGTQIQLRKYKIRLSKINHIFISHLHGDHIYGLPGLISSLALLGRRKALHIYTFPELEKILHTILKHSLKDMPYTIHFHHLTHKKTELIYEDKNVFCKSFPLKHSMPACGFVIQEKEKPANIRKEMISEYNIAIKDIVRIKEGADYTTDDGKVIPNSELTLPPWECRKYTYCSDTMYTSDIVPIINKSNILYHEATFVKEDEQYAKETMHSTTHDAAKIAQEAAVEKLIIGHFSSRYKDSSVFEQEARELFSNTKAVNDGDTFFIEPKRILKT